jgi:CRP/FNR family transcriptional regulator, cyclic AMP receptor protein
MTYVAHEQPVDLLASISLFADLNAPQLEAISHIFEEASFGAGERILRQGITGSNFHVIVEGEASVLIDEREVARLSRGEFFGEMSLLLGRPPIADVVATTPLRCLLLAGQDLRTVLMDYPDVMYRMLVTLARRLQAAESSGSTTGG